MSEIYIEDLISTLDNKNGFDYAIYIYDVGQVLKTDYPEVVINKYGRKIVDSWEIDCDNNHIEIWIKEK